MKQLASTSGMEDMRRGVSGDPIADSALVVQTDDGPRLSCPSCGSHEISFQEYVCRSIPGYRIEPGEDGIATLLVDMGTQRMVWEATTNECLFCSECYAELDFPHDTELDFE